VRDSSPTRRSWTGNKGEPGGKRGEWGSYKPQSKGARGGLSCIKRAVLTQRQPRSRRSDGSAKRALLSVRMRLAGKLKSRVVRLVRRCISRDEVMSQATTKCGEEHRPSHEVTYEPVPREWGRGDDRTKTRKGMSCRVSGKRWNQKNKVTWASLRP